jgi:hypothetical protein
MISANHLKVMADAAPDGRTLRRWFKDYHTDAMKARAQREQLDFHDWAAGKGIKLARKARRD